MTCPSCGSSVPERARFCPSCGYGLDARGDERRVVTVLFADVVGFTTLSEARDPEQVKNLIDRSFSKLAADVTAFGGRVDKIVGDAIVALFGAPVAHEDDAERAVRAALQMQQTMAAEIGGEVRLRVGVNTGEVLVGALRAGGDYTAMGDVVNVASRLQTTAQPGTVVVGPGTHAATQHVIRYEPLGMVHARGREGPVEAWQAVAPLAPPGHRPRRSRTPLVGRDQELAVLCNGLDVSLARRRAHLALILGEAGVGKSRLAEELADVAATQQGARVLEGRCVPYGEANVWWPVAEAMRHACAITPDDDAATTATKTRAAVRDALRDVDDADPDRVADGLLYLMGDPDALAEVDATRAKEEAIRSLDAFTEGLASAQPVVLVVSELHWADQLVFDLIDHLLERLRHLPVAVIATARPELEERWTPAAGRSNLVVLHLDPLREDAAAELVTALLGRVPPPELRAFLLERSGGNPLFLEELVALLGESVVPSELPATLRGLVAARLDALSPRERHLLEDAAVVGRAGAVTAVAGLAQARAEQDGAGLLAELVTKELVTLDGGHYEFRSEVVREVAYETLTKAERARRHAALARWLSESAQQTGREDEHLEQLAHHWGMAAELVGELGPVEGVPADVTTTALYAIERAAKRAKHQDTPAVTVRLLDHALKLLPEDEVVHRVRVLLERARSRCALRELAGAREDLDQALSLAGGHEVAVAKGLTIRGEIEQNEGDFVASVATLDEAVSRLRALDDPPGLGEALRQRGMSRLFAGQPGEAEEDFAEALALARDTGSRREEAWALWSLAWNAFVRGRIVDAEERLEDASRVFHEIGDWGAQRWARGLLAWVRFFQGRRPEAAALASGLVDQARRFNDRWGLGMMLMLVGGVSLWEGRPEEAVAPAREAVELFDAMGDRRNMFQAVAVLARSLAALGHDAEVRRLVVATWPEGTARLAGDERSMAAFAISGSFLHLGDPEAVVTNLVEDTLELNVSGDVARSEGRTTMAMVLLQLGDVAHALPEAVTAAGQAVADGPRANALAVAALANAAGGKPEDALAAADQVCAIAGATYMDHALAGIARGFALAHLRRADDASAAFDQVIDEVDRTSDRVFQAVVRLAAAEALDDARRREEAEHRLTSLGIGAAGWRRLLALTAPATPTATR